MILQIRLYCILYLCMDRWILQSARSVLLRSSVVVEELFCRVVFYENTNNSRSQSVAIQKYKKEVMHSRLESLPLGMYRITWFTFYTSSTGSWLRHILMTRTNKEVGRCAEDLYRFQVLYVKSTHFKQSRKTSLPI